MYRQSVSLGLALLLNAQVCLAQSTPAQHQVRVILTDATRHSIFGANVQQRLWPDTTQTSTTISDTAGVALLPAKPGASYQLRISALGYQPIEQGIRPTKNGSTYRFTLHPDTRTLATVTVTTRQTLMRQEDDKLIVNPELIANSSTNAYELLTKTPGLFLDQKGHIYLNSAVPATIYINGREQRMSAEDVATQLRSLPPTALTEPR